MATKDAAKRYMDLMARGLVIVRMFQIAFNQIYAISNYSKIAEDIRLKMNACWSADDEKLLYDLSELLQSIEHEKNKECRTVMAVELCKWLDSKITYLMDENNSTGERFYFSLHSLVPCTSNHIVIIDALNTNWEETGIWINPKFAIASPHVIRNEENVKKPIANRDIFEGLNGVLENCSYICWINENKYKIKNIIIPNNPIIENGNNNLTIAFSPMSDRADLVEIQEQIIEREGIEWNGEGVKSIKNADGLLDRLKNDWRLAADENADIFFAPELLGTELSEELDKNDAYNKTIRKLSNMRLRNGESLPTLTILPSRWSKQHNRATIVGWDGEVLACQDKHIPFVDQKNNKIEALMDLNEWVTVLIHIPSVHRIAIVICAEFLSNLKSMREVICGNLGATLIIVPSYSRGEQDFINTLSALKGYGTTVIWGNCCGAVRGEQKAIGGCGIAGTTKTEIFSSVCKCGYSCENISACIFMVEIPLDFELQKTNKFDKAECVTHKIKQIDQTK